MEHGTAGGARIHRAARRGRRVLARAPGRPAGRGLWALPAAALGITATLLGGTPAAAGTAPAVLSILSGPYRVRAAGQAWRLTLLVNDAPGSGASILATLTHRSPGGYEEHEWGAGRLPAASVRAIGGPGLRGQAHVHDHLAQGAALLPGLADRVLRHAGRAFRLSTGLRRVGTVGSRSITFKAPDHAYLDRGCVLARPPCPPSGYTWGGATRPSAGVLAALIGGVTRSGTIIGLLRTTRLARPRNAERTDGAIAKGAALSVSGGTLTTTAGAGTLLAGKVTVRTTGSPRVSVTSCWARGTRHSVTTSTYG